MGILGLAKLIYERAPAGVHENEMKNYFGRRIAITTVAFSLVMPLLAVGGIIITPDAPSVFFWGL